MITRKSQFKLFKNVSIIWKRFRWVTYRIIHYLNHISVPQNETVIFFCVQTIRETNPIEQNYFLCLFYSFELRISKVLKKFFFFVNQLNK